MVSNPFQDGLSIKIDSDTQGLTSGIENSIGKLGDFKKAALGVSSVAAGGLAAGFAKSVSEASDFEDAMIGVEKVTDPETAKAMEGAIMDMSESMPIAQSELAGIAEQAGRLGVEGEENIASFTETAAKMATSTDLTAEEAADSFARIGTLMDIPIDQSENLGSAMNELANTMGTSTSEISDVMTRAGGSMNQLGVAEDKALALAGAMNEVSPSSRLAAGGMKRMSEAMMDPSNVGAMAEALGVTEEEFRNMRENDPSGTLLKLADSAANSEDAANLLKSELGKAGQEFVTLGSNTDSARQAMETSNQAWEENTSLQEEADAAASTFSAKLDMLRNKLNNLAISIGQRLLPPLSNFIGWLVEGIDWVTQMNQKLDGALGVGALATALTALIPILYAATTAMWAMAAPVIAAAAPFIALGAAIGVLYYAVQNNILGLGTLFNNVMQRVTAAIQFGKQVIREFTTFVRTLMAGDFSAAWQMAKNAIRNAFRMAVTWLKTSAVPMIRNALVAIKNAAIQILTTLGTRAKQIVMEGFTAIANYIRSLGKEDIKAAFKAIGTAIRTLALQLFGAGGRLKEIVMNGLSAIATYLRSDAKGDVKSALVTLGDAAEQAFLDFVNALTPPDGLVAQMISDIASYLKNDAKSDVVAAIEMIVDGIMAAFEGLYEGLIGGSLIPKTFKEIASYIGGAAKSLIESAVDAVIEVIRRSFEAWYDWIIGGGGFIAETFSSIASYISSNAKSALKSAAQTALEAVLRVFDSFSSEVKSAVTSLFGELSSYISGTAASKLVSSAKSAASDAANALIDKFNAIMPDSFSIPSITVGGGSIGIPKRTVAGKKVPGTGTSVSIPSKKVGGQTLSIPQLDTGGFIEGGGLAMLHEGEQVVPAANVGERGGGGDHVEISVTIEGDADAHDMERGLSRALRSYNIGR